MIISRGELVEIGGGFRVPDVMAQSGARPARGRHHQPHARGGLRRGDLRSHRADPARAPVELPHRRIHRAAVARRAGRARSPLQRPVAEDLGSGYLRRPRRCRRAAATNQTSAATRRRGRRRRDVQRRQAARRTAGGDLAGQERAVDAVRRHPLMRALRVDKMTYAALEATLAAYAAGRAAADGARRPDDCDDASRRSERARAALVESRFAPALSADDRRRALDDRRRQRARVDAADPAARATPQATRPPIELEARAARSAAAGDRPHRETIASCWICGRCAPEDE